MSKIPGDIAQFTLGLTINVPISVFLAENKDDLDVFCDAVEREIEDQFDESHLGRSLTAFWDKMNELSRQLNRMDAHYRVFGVEKRAQEYAQKGGSANGEEAEEGTSEPEESDPQAEVSQ